MPWTEVAYGALVCLIAMLIVCAEVLLTFGASFFVALRNKWSWLLFLINFVFAGITYSIARFILNIESGLIVAAVVGALSIFLVDIAGKDVNTLFDTIAPVP